MTRRKFTDNFKRKAVAQLATMRAVDLEKKLRISSSVLSNWKKRFGGEVVNPKRHPPIVITRPKSSDKVATAVVLLNHARDAAIKEIKLNPERFDDPVYRLAMAARDVLNGS